MLAEEFIRGCWWGTPTWMHFNVIKVCLLFNLNWMSARPSVTINLCQYGAQTLALSRPFSKCQLQTTLTFLTLVSDVICALKKNGRGEGDGTGKMLSMLLLRNVIAAFKKQQRWRRRYENTLRWSDWWKSSREINDWRNRLNFPLHFNYVRNPFCQMWRKSIEKTFNKQIYIRNNIHGFFNSLLWTVVRFHSKTMLFYY